MNFSKALICAAAISSAEGTSACTAAQLLELTTIVDSNKSTSPSTVTSGDTFWSYILANKLSTAQKAYPCLTCYQTYAKAIYTKQVSSVCTGATAVLATCTTDLAAITLAFMSCTTSDAKDSSVLTGNFAVSAALAAAIVMLN